MLQLSDKAEQRAALSGERPRRVGPCQHTRRLRVASIVLGNTMRGQICMYTEQEGARTHLSPQQHIK